MITWGRENKTPGNYFPILDFWPCWSWLHSAPWWFTSTTLVVGPCDLPCKPWFPPFKMKVFSFHCNVFTKKVKGFSKTYLPRKFSTLLKHLINYNLIRNKTWRQECCSAKWWLNSGDFRCSDLNPVINS